MDLWAGATTAAEVDVLIPFVRTALVWEARSLGISVATDSDQAKAPAQAVPVQAAINHQLSPLLAAFRDELGFDEQSAAELQAEASSEGLAALALARATEQAWHAVSEQDIAVLAYKGVALSVTSTGSAVSRGSGDVDLLVQESDALSACRALAELGYAPELFSADFSSAHWRWLRWSTREICLEGPSSTIDLHWRITPEVGLLDHPAHMLHRAVEVELPEGVISTLCEDDALIVACYTLQHDSYRSLRQAVDLVRLLRQRTDAVPFQGRALAMACESAHFVNWQLGGLPEQHLAAIGLADCDIRRAQRLWTRNKHDPRTREPQPSLLGQVSRARGTYGHASFPLELARLVSLRLLTNRAERAVR